MYYRLHPRPCLLLQKDTISISIAIFGYQIPGRVEQIRCIALIVPDALSLAPIQVRSGVITFFGMNRNGCSSVKGEIRRKMIDMACVAIFAHFIHKFPALEVHGGIAVVPDNNILFLGNTFTLITEDGDVSALGCVFCSGVVGHQSSGSNSLPR